jgi:beta-lactamase class A
MATLERKYPKYYYRKRQVVRQRQMLLCAGLIALLIGMYWSVSTAFFPKYAWLKAPEDFYRPEMVSGIESLDKGLSPLPVHTEDTALRQKIEAELATYPETLKPHLFYVNLQDYSYVDINGNTPVPAASVIKLPLLLEYFRHVDKGELTPYTHLIYQDFEQAGGSGNLQYKPVGLPLLAKDVATSMIQESDNTSTNMLLYTFGGAEQFNQELLTLGLRGTHVNNWLPDLTGTNVISMHDMATVLYNIDQGPVLSQESRMAAMEILEGTHNRKLLPALLPRDTIIAHKTGDIGTSLGNSGLFILPDGQKYIIAVQVERPYNNYAAKEMIQKLSKVIYDDVMGGTSLAGSSSSKNTTF